jgi:ketosteroid isomerase-like protein
MHYRARLLITPLLVAAAVPLALSGAAISGASSHSNADSAAVAKVVNDFHDALSTGDSATALRLLSNDAVILESGEIETRSEYRAHHLRADIEFAKAVASRRGPLQVNVNGSVAWTAGTSTTKGDFKGRAIDSTGAESMTLTKEAAGWRIRSIHWSSRKRKTSS